MVALAAAAVDLPVEVERLVKGITAEALLIFFFGIPVAAVARAQQEAADRDQQRVGMACPPASAGARWITQAAVVAHHHLAERMLAEPAAGAREPAPLEQVDHRIPAAAVVVDHLLVLMAALVL
jgi:hypothetical protein